MSLTDRLKYAEMKARHEKHLRPWYQKPWGIFILIITALILITLVAAGIYVYKEVKRIQTEQAQSSLKDQRKAYEDLINGPGGYSLGSLTPKITVIEFTDFACPFCKESASEIRSLMEKYKDNVKLVVRDYPIHDTSIDLALAARCAGDQGKYWEAYDSLFANQDNLKSTTTIKADLLSWADFLNLDKTKFTTCLDSRGYVSLIKRDYEDGNRLQIKGTPTWFVNYYPITGYYPANKFEELFSGLLQQLK